MASSQLHDGARYYATSKIGFRTCTCDQHSGDTYYVEFYVKATGERIPTNGHSMTNVAIDTENKKSYMAYDGYVYMNRWTPLAVGGKR